MVSTDGTESGIRRSRGTRGAVTTKIMVAGISTSIVKAKAYDLEIMNCNRESVAKAYLKSCDTLPDSSCS
jgi:hypothetical protein